MITAEATLPVAGCFRQDGYVADWTHLAERVVARRVELGMRTRRDLAAAASVSTRVLGDIEKGRRSNYDAVTLTALEAALGWETGSIARILAGLEPRLRETPDQTRGTVGVIGVGAVSSTIAAALPDEIELIYASKSMTAEQKLRAIRTVLQLRAEVDQQQAPSRQPQRSDS